MKVKDVMTKEVIYVNKNDDLRHVIDLMEKHNITKLPVVDDSKVVGIVTDNKIADKLGSIRSKGIPAARLHASSVMEKEFEAVSPDTPIEEILATVGEPGPTMLPVTIDGNLVGVVTKADLLPLVKGKESVATIMTTPVITVRPDDRIVHARRLMLENDIARLPVIEEGKVVGIISDKEIAFAFAALKRSFSLGQQQHQLKMLLVKDVMKTPVITAKEDISIEEAAKIMIEKEVGCLPIVGGDEKIKGIVTRTDLLHYLRENYSKGSL
ncbi:MAG: CBS domain-containing protein [Thermoplasmata archaeon]|jgi:CBS domain-containing protein|nr:MAG: CBS domain-containing protein [Thermoplasmata archaeon]